jgi:hypothetical protein
LNDGSEMVYLHQYSLSIQVRADAHDARCPATTVKHYQIVQNVLTGLFELANSMSSRPRFQTVQALVASFEVIAPSRTDGVLLAVPCRRPAAIEVAEYTQLRFSPQNKQALKQARQATKIAQALHSTTTTNARLALRWEYYPTTTVTVTVISFLLF